jgi:hypothetical protein
MVTFSSMLHCAIISLGMMMPLLLPMFLSFTVTMLKQSYNKLLHKFRPFGFDNLGEKYKGDFFIDEYYQFCGCLGRAQRGPHFFCIFVYATIKDPTEFVFAAVGCIWPFHCLATAGFFVGLLGCPYPVFFSAKAPGASGAEV